jgi:DNA-directed RNA polymerase subunit L
MKKTNSITLSLQEQDKLILEKLNKLLESNRPLFFIDYKLKHPTWKNQYRLQINNIYISQQLSRLGCFKKKSLTLKFPSEQQCPESLLQHFLRGMWDGDGSLYLNPSKKLLCNLTSTLEFCNEFIYYINNKISINFILAKPRKGKVTRQIYLSNPIFTRIFLDWLYKDATIYLDRKYQRYIGEIDV